MQLSSIRNSYLILFIASFIIVLHCTNATPTQSESDSSDSPPQSSSESSTESSSYTESSSSIPLSSKESISSEAPSSTESSNGTESSLSVSSNESSYEWLSFAFEPLDKSGLTKKELSDHLFDDDTIRTYEIILDPDSLAKIDKDPIKEVYVQGSLVVEGDTIFPVGIRYKGNEGAWWGCVQNGPWGGGKKTCPKLSIKIKINWATKDTTFYGLKKFQLHSMNTYNSQLRERLGYWFYREMGVPAPRVVHSKLVINGRYAGLFAHVENIDGRFTNYHFGDGSGNLYKESWPLKYDSTAMPDSHFKDNLKTNEEASDVSMMHTFADDLEAADSATIKTVIEKWMDIETTLKVAAVMYTLDDDDGAFHWYALSEAKGFMAKPHNLFWYEEPDSNKIHLLPWDVDHMLTNVAQPDTSNAVELRDGWGEKSHDCSNFGQGWPQRSAACDKLVDALTQYETEYITALQAVYDGPFSNMDAMIAKWEHQLTPETELMYDSNPLLLSPSLWQSGLEEMKRELRDAKEQLEGWLE